jgi:hypothetical protein
MIFIAPDTEPEGDALVVEDRMKRNPAADLLRSPGERLPGVARA